MKNLTAMIIKNYSHEVRAYPSIQFSLHVSLRRNGPTSAGNKNSSAEFLLSTNPPTWRSGHCQLGI